MTRVLIVDDKRENRYMLRALLRGHGFTVDEADNGAEALERAREHAPDLAISDLLMPVVDGYTLLRQWRADERLRAVPFIVYTATYTEPRDERLALALGADAFLIKPTEPEPFLARVRDVLTQRAHGAPAAAPAPPADEAVTLKEYNEVLVHKLEKKAQEVERVNRELREEIAERKRVEGELRESEERFRVTFEQAAVGIAHVGTDGRFLRVNDKLCEITGYPRAELLQLRFLELTLPDERPQADASRRALLDGTLNIYTVDKQYLRKDGVVVWVNLVSTLLRDERGQPKYFITVTTDITDRKRSEEALRLRDRAIQAVAQGIVITDPNRPDNPIVYSSAGFERITGYRSDEVVGRNCRFLQGRDTDRETVAKLRAAVAAGHACAVEVLNYRKDGTSFWNALSLNTVHDERGGLAYFVGVQNDLTDRKKLEDQFRQSQKMEAVGRLAGGIAHDFNNLLTVISGHSALLLARPDIDLTFREALEAIGEAGTRAAALTRQLLGFSRQTMLQPTVLNVNAVIAETEKLLRRLIGEDVEITTAPDPTLSPVRVDPSHLDQVLMNLAVNARDAMPRGGRLTIETANVTINSDAAPVGCKPGRYVMLAMTDTGCGMTPEVLARIFEPFYTTKEIGKGTGLGLAMVFGIVQQSEGFIRVASESGRGATFKIYLPAVGEDPAKRTDAPLDTPIRGSETILLVEDDEGVRALAVLSLTAHGYRVLTAADGKEALSVVRAHNGPIDLVLTDVVMPNLSGPDLATILKAQFPHVKVLFMSGYTDDAVIRHGLLTAEVAFIQKPYPPLGLVQKVRNVLDEDKVIGG